MSLPVDALFKRVSSSKSVTVESIRQRYEEASPELQGVFLFFLEHAAGIPGAELTTRNSGVSCYGIGEDSSRRRECFHFGIRRNDLVICQHAKIPDPQNVFANRHPGDNYRSGYVSVNDPELNQYILDIFRRSYQSITGISVGKHIRKTESQTVVHPEKPASNPGTFSKDDSNQSEHPIALPCLPLRRILLKAYKPCDGFSDSCKADMRWDPAASHIPRGCYGATGQSPDEVKLVLVVAEPGDPQPGESYAHCSTGEEMLAAACAIAQSCFMNGTDQYHRNIRKILKDCWPGTTFQEQMQRTWITESCLCSASSEGAPVGRKVTDACGTRFLREQLRLMPNAVVIALGSKAQKRLSQIGVKFISAFSAAPPGCNFSGAAKSWQKVTDCVRALGDS
jgi:hypothetical protein